MMRFLSIAALASAAIIAAIANSPAEAAAVRINSFGTGAHVGVLTNATGGRQFAPNTPIRTGQTSRQGPKQRRWVCGPIVNYDGTPHCHWVG
jgi:hypothetical protein